MCKQRWLIGLALLLALPIVGETQSIKFQGASGGETRTLLPWTAVSLTPSGTTEEVMYTINLPANTFPTNEGFIVRFTAVHAANTNNTFLRLRVGGIGGTVVHQTVAGGNGATYAARAEARVYSATSLVVYNYSQTTAGTVSFPALTLATGLTFTGSIALVITIATPTSVGDLTLTGVQASLIL